MNVLLLCYAMQQVGGSQQPDTMYTCIESHSSYVVYSTCMFVTTSLHWPAYIEHFIYWYNIGEVYITIIDMAFCTNIGTLYAQSLPRAGPGAYRSTESVCQLYDVPADGEHSNIPTKPCTCLSFIILAIRNHQGSILLGSDCRVQSLGWGSYNRRIAGCVLVYLLSVVVYVEYSTLPILLIYNTIVGSKQSPLDFSEPSVLLLELQVPAYVQEDESSSSSWVARHARSGVHFRVTLTTILAQLNNGVSPKSKKGSLLQNRPQRNMAAAKHETT